MEEKRDLKMEIEQLKQAHPELEQMPEEVATAMMKGQPASEAYKDYLEGKKTDSVKELKRENEDLKKQIRILKQNADVAARSVVGSTTGCGSEEQRRDKFLDGLDSDEW